MSRNRFTVTLTDSDAVLNADTGQHVSFALAPGQDAAPMVPTVAELLAASRLAHLRYRRAHADTKNGDDLAMLMAVRDAQMQRKAAHDADPDHRDPAWATDALENRGVTHDQLLQFYGSYLGSNGR